MLNKLRNLSIAGILTLVFSFLALVSPIIWDWYKEKVEITVQTKSIASVISKDLPIQNLEVLYSGKKVDALSRIQIEIENTGRTPITSADVIKPIEIIFFDGEIVEATVPKLYPSNLDISLDISTTNKVVTNFALLNPKDKVTVDLLILGTTTKFDAKARIKNINELNVIDNLEVKKSNPISLYLIPMVFLSLLLCWYGISETIPNWLKKSVAQGKLLKGTHDLYNANNYDNLIKRVFEEKSFSPKQQEHLLSALISINFPLGPEEKNEIIDKIEKEELFKNKKLVESFLAEIILLIVFGVVPVFGILKSYYSLKS